MRPVSIIIPVIRPKLAERCIKAIKKHITIEYEIIAEKDTKRIGCPKMIKRLIEKTKYDLVMFLGDDTIPEKDFAENAIKAMDTLPDGWGLVGINDQQPCRKIAAAHWLADKRLLPLLGNELFHTGYVHGYCDEELLERCIDLGRFVWAKDAKIKHDNPVFKGEKLKNDYARIYSKVNVRHDRNLYLDRKRERLNIEKKIDKNAIVIMGMPLGRNMKIDIRTAEFAFKEMAKDGWEWSMKLSEAAEYSRNEIVWEMLKGDFTHLFFLDADTFPPFGTIERLLAHNKDIVAGITPVFIGQKLWNYQLIENERMPICNLTNDLFTVARTGMTTILIKRKVFENMKFPYYRTLIRSKKSGLSHDYAWCDKARKLGYEIWIDPTIVCGHSNTVNLSDVF